MPKDTYTTAEIARLLGTDTWRVRRLFKCGRLPEPPRFAGKRVIPNRMIADVAIALRERGWLSVEAASPLQGAARD